MKREEVEPLRAKVALVDSIMTRMTNIETSLSTIMAGKLNDIDVYEKEIIFHVSVFDKEANTFDHETFSVPTSEYLPILQELLTKKFTESLQAVKKELEEIA